MNRPLNKLSFLSPSPEAMNVDQFAQETTRASNSRAFARVLGNQGSSFQDPANPEAQTDLINESSFVQQKADSFRTDTSDVEDLLDCSGVKRPVNQTTSTNPFSKDWVQKMPRTLRAFFSPKQGLRRLPLHQPRLAQQAQPGTYQRQDVL